jgi:hypothetical protein
MSEDTTVEATESVATTTKTEQAQGPDLTVQDLQALKSIIDVASQRGAFKPNEMMTVGQTYNKLEQFLAAVAQQQPAQGA